VHHGHREVARECVLVLEQSGRSVDVDHWHGMRSRPFCVGGSCGEARS
jgi:hypothetical protein